MDSETEAPAHPLDGLISYKDFIAGLVGDLTALRAGELTVAQARARSDLAKQIVRAVAVGLDAQRLLVESAKPVNVLPGVKARK